MLPAKSLDFYLMCFWRKHGLHNPKTLHIPHLLLKASSISERVDGIKEKEHISLKPIACIWISENTRGRKENDQNAREGSKLSRIVLSLLSFQDPTMALVVKR